MSVEIREVVSKRDLKKFIRFPYALYKNHPCWVPPLRFDEMNTLHKDKNPAFEVCDARYWLAYKDGKIAGRVAAIHNKPYVEKWNRSYLRFGWIDFIDDEEVSRALIDAVEGWARELGMAAVHGPLGFTDLDNEGMLVEGFDELGTLATIYNYPYYPEHLEKLGYKKDADWLEFQATVPDEIPDKIERLAQQIMKKANLRLLKVKKRKELLAYTDQMFDVLDNAYSVLYGVVPLTRKQVEYYVKQYFGFVRPEYISMILNGEDRVVGFGVSMPSLSRALQRNRGRLFPFGFISMLQALKSDELIDLYLIGVEPEWQGKGVNVLVIYDILKSFVENKVHLVESNPELEENYKVQRQWKYFDLRQHKRRRCFIKELTNPEE